MLWSCVTAFEIVNRLVNAMMWCDHLFLWQKASDFIFYYFSNSCARRMELTPMAINDHIFSKYYFDFPFKFRCRTNRFKTTYSLALHRIFRFKISSILCYVGHNAFMQSAYTGDRVLEQVFLVVLQKKNLYWWLRLCGYFAVGLMRKIEPNWFNKYFTDKNSKSQWYVASVD